MRSSRARFHQLDALACADFVQARVGIGIGDRLGIARAENLVRGDVDEIRIRVLDLVEAGLDALHVVDVFDRALFAGGDDQPLLVRLQRNLGDFLLGGRDGEGKQACPS